MYGVLAFRLSHITLILPQAIEIENMTVSKPVISIIVERFQRVLYQIERHDHSIIPGLTAQIRDGLIQKTQYVDPMLV